MPAEEVSGGRFKLLGLKFMSSIPKRSVITLAVNAHCIIIYQIMHAQQTNNTVKKQAIFIFIAQSTMSSAFKIDMF